MLVDVDRCCWKCFKSSESYVPIAGRGFRLCKSCAWEIERMENFLRANGVMFANMGSEDLPGPLKTRDGEKEGSRGKKGAEEVGVDLTPTLVA